MMMMRVFIAVALLVCVLGVEATIKDSIMADSHRCCVSSCSAEERESLQKRVHMYEHSAGEDAEEVRKYYDASISGAACSGSIGKRSNAATLTNTSSVSLDVANSSKSFTVTFSLAISTGIYYSYIYATLYFNNTKYYYCYPDNNYYQDSTANQTTITKTVTFTVARYSPYGTWQITAYGYGPNYSPYVSTTGYFVVLQTLNDVKSPVLVSITAPVFNLNDLLDRAISFVATDDVSGLNSVQGYISDAQGNNVAYVSYSGQYINGQYVGATYVSSVLTNFYNFSAIVQGTYYLSFYCYDVVGSYTYYSTAQLSAAGIQSSITFATGTCPAGRSAPYNSNANCALCQKGTFSNFVGAFRCKACLPGSASNAAGVQNCTICPPGTAGIGGSSGCEICPAGTYSSGYGNQQCTPCFPGTNSTDGAEYCTACPAGTYSNGGSSTCSQCAPGTFNSYGSYCCTQCPSGTFSSGYGATQCTMCPSGFYSWNGFTTCTQCPSNTPNGPIGSNSRLNCN